MKTMGMILSTVNERREKAGQSPLTYSKLRHLLISAGIQPISRIGPWRLWNDRLVDQVMDLLALRQKGGRHAE